MTFENDEARRARFTEELRKKLQDPDFRKIEGFPIGSDEDILNLSDPPYYTACPNPWIADFIADWEQEKLTTKDTKSTKKEIEENFCDLRAFRGSGLNRPGFRGGSNF
jgi:hypothetical protein